MSPDGKGTPGNEPVELQWRRTWTDDLEREDYVGVDRDMAVGRIYSMPGHYYAPPWRWFFGGCGGTANSRREAMLKIEAEYNDARAKRAEAGP